MKRLWHRLLVWLGLRAPPPQPPSVFAVMVRRTLDEHQPDEGPPRMSNAELAARLRQRRRRAP